MKRMAVVLGLMLMGVVLFAVPASGAVGGKLAARPSLFNGASCPGSHSYWNQNRVLVLFKNCSTSVDASADATITPIGNVGVLHSLGFDHQIGTQCTNGAPRWDVEDANGGVYAVGCAAGTHTPLPSRPGWERISFGNGDVQTLSGPAWPGFSHITPNFLQVLQDEGTDQGSGRTRLDNLVVNARTIRHSGLN